MAQDLAKSGVELPALMTAGRWKSSLMPAQYTEGQAAGRGAVARYYQGRGVRAPLPGINSTNKASEVAYDGQCCDNCH